MTWFHSGGPGLRVYASYRAGAGADWTPEEVVARNASLQQVGIDDAGRVLLLFSRGPNPGSTRGERLYAVRRIPGRGWEDPHRLAGGDLAAELGCRRRRLRSGRARPFSTFTPAGRSSPFG